MKDISNLWSLCWTYDQQTFRSSPPGSPPLWLKAGAWVESESERDAWRRPKSGQQAFRCSPPGSPPSRLKAGAWVESERPSWKSGQQAFESESDLFRPASALAVVSPGMKTSTFSVSLVAISVWVLGDCKSQPAKVRLLFGFWGIKAATWQVAISVWVLGDCKSQPAKVRLLFGFWGIKAATWQVATSVWVLGNQGCNLASCDFSLGSGDKCRNLASGDLCLGSGGSRLQPGKLRPLFGLWGIKVTTWQVGTSGWVLGDERRNLASCNFCLGSGG
ncbi:hypothetical protein B0H10DRAFT_1943632 [Mycena sp. CBHHK59/15]|nr:hypothetical protein B0H10DRAFT_1943632 [Mycena sp. CBHHK59/15]